MLETCRNYLKGGVPEWLNGPVSNPDWRGGLAERFKATVSKTVLLKRKHRFESCTLRVHRDESHPHRMDQPFFSIIIPTLNEEKDLPLLLTSIEKQTDKDFEIIVVDGQSTDNTKERAERFINRIPNFRFIVHKCRNVSVGRNYGSTFTQGKFLIFFDADVEIEKNFIKKIKEKIIGYNLDITTVWNRPKTSGLTGKIALTLVNLGMSIFQKIKPGANGPCIIIKKELFEGLRGFDEKIIFGEDFDLIQRAWRKKARFKVFPKPILYVSTRRFEKEGLLMTIYKSGRALLYQLFFGPIKKPIFDYQMGGQYYK